MSQSDKPTLNEQHDVAKTLASMPKTLDKKGTDAADILKNMENDKHKLVSPFGNMNTGKYGGKKSKSRRTRRVKKSRRTKPRR